MHAPIGRELTAPPPGPETLPATQQPDWRTDPAHERIMAKLATAAPLVHPEEIRTLRAALAAVAAGTARVIQAGDCAETFYESTADHTSRKIDMLDRLAGRLGERTGQAVVRIGRFGGQYAKPRSHPVEVVDGVELPAFRGHLINSEAPSPIARRHDPRRMLWGYHFSDEVQRMIRTRRGAATPDRGVHTGPWSSHDALVMDYELSLIRVDERTGEDYLASTHFPWIGARTCAVDGAHVAMLSRTSNPVAVKVGPRTNPGDLTELCAWLDPEREPGRLTLIARLGHAAAGEALPPLVRAVRDAGHPVVWLNDPMHGNTVRLPSGLKTRYLEHLVAEAVEFRRVLADHAQHAGGLHLETAAEEVTECVGGPVLTEDQVPEHYTTLCDPRLSVEQAEELVDSVF